MTAFQMNLIHFRVWVCFVAAVVSTLRMAGVCVFVRLLRTIKVRSYALYIVYIATFYE